MCVHFLPGAVEMCLQHGLKKRALGLFKNSTTNALLQKLSKTYEPASQVVKLLQECENNNDPKTTRSVGQGFLFYNQDHY